MTSYSGGNGELLSQCGMAMLLAVLITIMVLQVYKNGNGTSKGSAMTARRHRERMSPQYLGSTPGKQVLTGPIGYNKLQDKQLMMPPHAMQSYINQIHPPDTTWKTPGANGVGQCWVSSVNNLPHNSDLYYKCANNSWSKEAIGEALALSSVGSYYLPSEVEDQKLNKYVSMAHDPVTANCMDAAKLKPYTRSDPSSGL
uniref:Uncharacterized protein n=1 Tax=viral metagenome TaxID=1070528 RepID=A0A6C0LLT3_9ZZZZ